MKKLLCLMVFITITLSQWASADTSLPSSSKTDNSLAGTWELEYAIYKNAQGEVVGEIKDKTTLSRKILSAQHFAFITWSKEGVFTVAASGTYQLKGSDYLETIDVTSEARLMGKTYEFNATINNDLWIHKGMEDGILIEEHWRKLP